MKFVSQNPSIATFQLSSAASLNLGWSQNGVFGNGLMNMTNKAFENMRKKKEKKMLSTSNYHFLLLLTKFYTLCKSLNCYFSVSIILIPTNAYYLNYHSMEGW